MQLNDHETIAAYDAIAGEYDKYSDGKRVYLSAVDQLVIQALQSCHRVLDVGAGNGTRLFQILQQVAVNEVVAVEPSANMARLCQSRLGIPVHQINAEALGQLNIGKFDAILALWNVFGHIGGSDQRLTALKAMKEKLNANGKIIIDVNNRHNAASYGYMKVFSRVLMDSLFFKESRGDARYDWKIGDKTFKSAGHLFVPREIESLFAQAGLRVKSCCSVNYQTGAVSPVKLLGQLFYILEAKDQGS